MPGLDTYFMEVSVYVSLNVGTKGSFKVKKTRKIYIFKGFLKQMECDFKKLSFYNKFRIPMPGSNLYILEVSAHVSLKVAKNGSFRGKKNSKNLAF